MLQVKMSPEQRQNLFVFLSRVDLKGREVSQFNELVELFSRAMPDGLEGAPGSKLKMGPAPEPPVTEAEGESKNE